MTQRTRAWDGVGSVVDQMQRSHNEAAVLQTEASLDRQGQLKTPLSSDTLRRLQREWREVLAEQATLTRFPEKVREVVEQAVRSAQREDTAITSLIGLYRQEFASGNLISAKDFLRKALHGAESAYNAKRKHHA